MFIHIRNRLLEEDLLIIRMLYTSSLNIRYKYISYKKKKKTSTHGTLWLHLNITLHIINNFLMINNDVWTW